MKSLVIVGAGGCGREVFQWAKRINIKENRWKSIGFLDDDPNALTGVICDAQIVGAVQNYPIEAEDEFICCIGNSSIRKSVSEDLKNRGAQFITLIHPSAVISDNCRIGEGVVIYPFALISDNAAVGNGSIVNMYSSIAHDSRIGEYCTISAHCDVTGNCSLGDRVFMGTTSHIVPGTTVGNDVYICAGSTVMTRIRDKQKVMGNPARIVTF